MLNGQVNISKFHKCHFNDIVIYSYNGRLGLNTDSSCGSFDILHLKTFHTSSVSIFPEVSETIFKDWIKSHFGQ